MSENDEIQIVDTPSGKYAFLSLEALDQLRTAVAAIEDQQDIEAGLLALERIKSGQDEFVPFSITKQLEEGENPIRVWRKHRKLSIKELASRAGVSQPFLSNVETGKKSASFQVMTIIARALDITLDDLVPWDDGKSWNEAENEVEEIRGQTEEVGSAFDKLADPENTDPGDWDIDLLLAKAEEMVGHFKRIVELGANALELDKEALSLWEKLVTDLKRPGENRAQIATATIINLLPYLREAASTKVPNAMGDPGDNKVSARKAGNAKT